MYVYTDYIVSCLHYKLLQDIYFLDIHDHFLVLEIWNVSYKLCKKFFIITVWNTQQNLSSSLDNK